jgi:AraC family transcriptional regulator, positive regulator of tynA and feaB
MSAEQPIQHFSTGALPPGMRFDYWMSILCQSLWPVTQWTVPRDFNVELREAPLGCLSLMTETISPSDAYRTARDIENTGDPCYLLFANQRSWVVSHRDHCECYAPGEVVLVDSQGELKTSAPSGFQGSIIKLPVRWLQTWLPDPELLVGRRIAKDSPWGNVFLPIVSQLTPEVAAAPPLPHGVLVDQVGAVLALIAGEAEARAMPDLLKRIRACIRERCCEPQLTAADVADTLNVPVRELHRALTTNNLTFASQLLDARIGAALHMLTSPAFAKLTTGEIAHQAGFLSASHFGRVVHKRTGHSPVELRQSRH